MRKTKNSTSFLQKIYIPKKSKGSKQVMGSVSEQNVHQRQTPSGKNKDFNTIKVGDIVSEFNGQGFITSGAHVLVVEEIDPSSGKAFIVNTDQLGIWTPTKSLRKGTV